jgi:hypothetical protein
MLREKRQMLWIWRKLRTGILMNSAGHELRRQRPPADNNSGASFISRARSPRFCVLDGHTETCQSLAQRGTSPTKACTSHRLMTMEPAGHQRMKFIPKSIADATAPGRRLPHVCRRAGCGRCAVRPHLANSSRVFTVTRKRAAPPVTTRWSKVSEGSRTRRAASTRSRLVPNKWAMRYAAQGRWIVPRLTSTITRISSCYASV